MKFYNIFKTASLFFLIINFSFPQFTKVKVNVDTRLLRGGTEDIHTNALRDEVESYYLVSIFAPEATDLALTVDIRLVIESVTEGNNRKVINGQALFSNYSDQKYFARGFEFPFENGQTVVFTPNYEPVASFFDYYAFLFIAGELDTYDEFGGNVYYGKALDLSYEGKSAGYSRGWDVRYKRCGEIMDNLEFRRAKFQFYQAYDIAMAEMVKKKELQNPLGKFISHLQNANYEVGFDRYMQIFLKAHAEEIGSMMSAVDMIDELNVLVEIDVENKDIYKSFIGIDKK